MQDVVQILLATYNGASFLKEQLDSLFNQTIQPFTILIRDDGSTDNTLQIIADYQKEYSDKIQLLNDDLGNVGAARNFAILLENATADYIFFCDQDDIWVHDKIELSLQKIKMLEQENNQLPCLVFSDMKWIDKNGKIINDSLWEKWKLHIKYFTFNRLLVQNIPHGCTILINKAMRNLACPIPDSAILHDHWIALLAAAVGKWTIVPKSTVLLRFHENNVTQLKRNLSEKAKRFYTNFMSDDEYEFYIKIRVQQAKALQQRIETIASAEHLATLKEFIALQNTKGLARKKIFIQNKFFRTTFWHTFKMIARA